MTETLLNETVERERYDAALARNQRYYREMRRFEDALLRIAADGPPPAANPDTWAHRLASIARDALAG